ncbi:MAG: glycosyltransferase family 2 protein [Planctomycetota bacterium]
MVVDDGSPDNTEEVVQSMQESVRYTLRYIKHANQGPGYTQNQGIRMANAPIVCLIADDIHLVPEALEAHLKSHQIHPGLNVAILGKVLQSPELTQSVFLKKWDPFRFEDLENFHQLPYYMFWACNISCKKKFLLDNGLFREPKGRAGAAAHEDVELGYRLWKKGLRIHYNKEAVGYHYHVETLEGAIRRAYVRGQNWIEFRKLVNEPEMTVCYNVLNLHTLKDYVQTFRRPNNLIGEDGSLSLIILRQMIRIAFFNSITVPLFWVPLMRCADKNSFLAHVMDFRLYLYVMFYYFLKGISRGRKALRDSNIVDKSI